MRLKNKVILTSILAFFLGTFTLVPFLIFSNVVNVKNIETTNASIAYENSALTPVDNTTVETLDQQMAKDILEFRNKGVNLIKNYTISSNNLNWISNYKFVQYTTGIFAPFIQKKDSVTINMEKKNIDVKFDVLNDGQIALTVQKANLESKNVNTKTGEGLDNSSKYDFKEWLNHKWAKMGGNLEFNVNLGVGVDKKQFIFPTQNPIKLANQQESFQKNVVLTMNNNASAEQLWRYSIVGSYVGIFAEAKINFDANNRDYQIDSKDNPFFDQVLYQIKKDDVIKWINYAFDILNENDRRILLEGPDGVNGRDWNLADLVHESMPPFLKWNENAYLLFEMEKIADLVELFYTWESTVATSSSWAPAIRNFTRDVINAKKFNSYNQLKDIYDKFYNLSITDPSNATTLNDFIKAKDELIKSNVNYLPKINQVDNYLKTNKINKPIINVGTQLPNLMPCNDYNKIWQPYQLLSYFLKGVLISNDLIADFEVDIDGGRNKTTKQQILYSSNNNLINNAGLSNALIGTDVSEGGKIQNVNVSNIKIQNPLKTRFLNLNSEDKDISKFNKLSSQLKNIKIKYNPNALDIVGFNYENWTKNKDAIGLNINKYLTEIINFENSENKLQNDFINSDVMMMIKEVINGDYSYLSDNNEMVKISQPVWLYSGRQGYENYKQKLIDNIFSISQNNIDNLITNQKLFSTDQWKESWEKFGINLDAKENKYPLWAPKQENGEFFIIGKINNFFTSSNYKTLKENTINNPKPPIVLINRENKDNNPNGDGYLLIKLKTCFNKTYDTNINNLRNYEVAPSISSKKTIKQSLDMFKTDILGAENNKYLLNTKIKKENNSFFTNESWTENNWSLNENLIWKNMFSKDGVLLGNEEVKKNVISYFRTKIYSDLVPYMNSVYSQNSDELNSFNYFIDNYEIYELFVSLINDSRTIGGIPFIFSNKLWNTLDKYIEYTEINAKVQFAVNEADKIVAQKELDQNQFNKFLISNDKNEQRLFTNDEIFEMFNNILTIKTDIFDREIDDEYKAYLTECFKKFQINWNTNITGGSINISTTTLSFADWKQQLDNYLFENDPAVIYQTQCQNLFLKNYNYYLKDVVNKLTFKVGNKINNNLVFASLDELIRDGFVKLIFDQYNIDINEAFKKQPYVINGSIIENEYFYEVNNDYNWPFMISTTYINDVKYYSLSAGKNDFSIDVDLNLLKEIANINFIDNKKPVYKVRENNVELKRSLAGTIDEIQKQFDDWEQESFRKDNLKSEINIGSVLLVTLLPLGVIAVGLLLLWLIKTKKRKVEF